MTAHSDLIGKMLTVFTLQVMVQGEWEMLSFHDLPSEARVAGRKAGGTWRVVGLVVRVEEERHEAE